MEALSNVRTIVSIAQDILAAVETASRNKNRCGRVARRVRRLTYLLGELDGAEAGTATDAAMRILLEELEEALGRALQLVCRCQRAGFLRALVVAGGRMGDPLDEVERDIDRCVQDLGLANYVRTARLEKRLRQVNEAASTTDDDEEKDESNGGKLAAGSVPDDKKTGLVPLRGGAKKDDEGATAAEDVPATGVPVLCTVDAGMCEHGHGHGYCYWHHSHGYGTGTCDCWNYYCYSPYYNCNQYSPYYNCNQYSSYPYPSIFSDDNPNSCSII